MHIRRARVLKFERIKASGVNLSMIIRGLDKKNVWKYENGFHWFSDPSVKFVGYYELYKSVAHLNADIIEFGFKGASLIRLRLFDKL